MPFISYIFSIEHITKKLIRSIGRRFASNCGIKIVRQKTTSNGKAIARRFDQIAHDNDEQIVGTNQKCPEVKI